jgi:hypothetical protein
MGSLVAGSVTSAILVQKTGRYKPFVLAGFAVSTVGLYLMSTMDAETTLFGVTWRMVLLGFGVGPVLPQLALAITNAVDPRQMGAATSSRTFFQNIGQTLSVAIFGVIMTTTLTNQLEARLAPIKADLPPAFADRFDTSQLKNRASTEGGSGEAVDISATIETEIHKAFAEQRDLVTRALQQGDQAAAARLAENPLAPAELKALVAPGALEARVQQAMDEQYAQLAAVLKSGDTAAVVAFAAQPQTPAPLRDALQQALAQVPPGAALPPQMIEGILAGAKQAMAAQKDQAVAAAREKALAGILDGLTQAEEKAVAQGKETGAKVTAALKESFAAATTPLYFYGMFILLAGLVAMFWLPEIPLRKGGHAPPAALE